MPSQHPSLSRQIFPAKKKAHNYTTRPSSLKTRLCPLSLQTPNTHSQLLSPFSSYRERERERDVWLGRGRRVLQRPSSLMARRPRRHRRPGGRRQPPLRPPKAKGVHPWLRDRQKRVPLQRKPGPQP